jgi:hypothetical protein
MRSSLTVSGISTERVFVTSVRLVCGQARVSRCRVLARQPADQLALDGPPRLIRRRPTDVIDDCQLPIDALK